MEYLGGLESISQDNLTGASFQTELFSASVVTNTTHAKIEFVLRISQSQLGWISIGHGTRMSNSRMMIIWPVTVNEKVEERRDWMISYRSATGHMIPKSLSRSEKEFRLKINQSSSMKNPSTSFNFIRPLILDPLDRLSREPAQEFVWAVSSLRPLGREPDGRISYHDLGYGLVKLNLDERLFPNRTIRSETDSLRDLTHSYRHDGLITVHATLLSIAWIICSPAAVLSARLMRSNSSSSSSSSRWVKVHWILNTFTFIFTFIGLICANFAVGVGSHFDSHQKKLGFLVGFGMLFQVLEGYLIHSVFKKIESKRALKNWFHIIFGSSLILLSWITIFFGIKEWETQGRGTPLSVSVIMGFTMGLTLFLYAIGLFRQRQSPEKSKGEKIVHSMIEISSLDLNDGFQSSFGK
ncbi:hypothetical protein DFH28DRAFT_1170471 [Melampsora americana]|nr:hypothetical protein DFH28DRAFT_1170471 [Melampsora americana]